MPRMKRGLDHGKTKLADKTNHLAHIIPELHRRPADLFGQAARDFGFALGSVAAALGPVVEQLVELRPQAVDLQLAAGFLLQPA